MAAAQVLGAGVVAQAAQVDHALDALVAAMWAKFAAAALALGEIVVGPAAHAVDEVVGDVHSLAGAAQGVGFESRRPRAARRPGLQRGGPATVTHQRAHLVA